MEQHRVRNVTLEHIHRQQEQQALQLVQHVLLDLIRLLDHRLVQLVLREHTLVHQDHRRVHNVTLEHIHRQQEQLVHQLVLHVLLGRFLLQDLQLVPHVLQERTLVRREHHRVRRVEQDTIQIRDHRLVQHVQLEHTLVQADHLVVLLVLWGRFLVKQIQDVEHVLQGIIVVTIK